MRPLEKLAIGNSISALGFAASSLSIWVLIVGEEIMEEGIVSVFGDSLVEPL